MPYYIIFYHVTLFQLHRLQLSLLLYMSDSSFLLESLTGFFFKGTGPWKRLLPPWVLYSLLHWFFLLSSQRFGNSQNSIFGPLFFVHIQPGKSHPLTNSNLQLYTVCSQFKPKPHSLAPFPIAYQPAVSLCSNVTSNIIFPKLDSLNSFAVSFSSKSNPQWMHHYPSRCHSRNLQALTPLPHSFSCRDP